MSLSCKTEPKRKEEELEKLKCPVILVAKSTAVKHGYGYAVESNIIVVSSGDGIMLSLGGRSGTIYESQAAVAIASSRNIGDTLVMCK